MPPTSLFCACLFSLTAAETTQMQSDELATCSLKLGQTAGTVQLKRGSPSGHNEYLSVMAMGWLK